MNTKMTQKLLAEVEKLPFDLEDVEKFERFHKSYCNGTYIRAVAKKDVCDEWAYDGYTLKRKGKYSLHATWEILGKDFPKFRKFVLELLTEKENFKTSSMGAALKNEEIKSSPIPVLAYTSIKAVFK